MKKYLIKTIMCLIHSIRPFLGPPGVCIYSVCCQDYTEFMLKNRPLYVAIPLICIRLLSCNPITALILRIKNRFSQ